MVTGDGARGRGGAVALESLPLEAEFSSDLEGCLSIAAVLADTADGNAAADDDDKTGEAADSVLCNVDEGDTVGDSAFAFTAESLAASGRALLPFSLSTALRDSPPESPCFEGDFFFLAEEWKSYNVVMT